MNNVLKLCLAVATLVVAGAAAYYLLVIQPREAQAQVNNQRQQAQQTLQESQYEACLRDSPQGVAYGAAACANLKP